MFEVLGAIFGVATTTGFAQPPAIQLQDLEAGFTIKPQVEIVFPENMREVYVADGHLVPLGQKEQIQATRYCKMRGPISPKRSQRKWGASHAKRVKEIQIVNATATQIGLLMADSEVAGIACESKSGTPLTTDDLIEIFKGVAEISGFKAKTPPIKEPRLNDSSAEKSPD